MSAVVAAFVYDSLNRLTNWTLNNGQPEAYGYDGASGNLASKGGVSYTYDTAHKHASRNNKAIS
jgi:YD repeat-containing protein